MIERYSRKEIKSIWEDKNKYSIWLKIELAAAEAMEKFKIIPKGVSKTYTRENFTLNFFARRRRGPRAASAGRRERERQK